MLNLTLDGGALGSVEKKNAFLRRLVVQVLKCKNHIYLSKVEYSTERPLIDSLPRCCHHRPFFIISILIKKRKAKFDIKMGKFQNVIALIETCNISSE